MVGSFVYGDFNSNHSGTSMPVEEPSTASGVKVLSGRVLISEMNRLFR